MNELQTLGGPGSGNFDHSGRPGQVGGSGSGVTSWSSWKNSGGWDESHLSIKVNGKIVGGADVQDTGDTMFVSFIHVDTKHQGQGHGKAMLREIVQEANKRGRTTISGESSSESYRRVADKMLGEPKIHGDQDYLKNETEGVMVIHTIPSALRAAGGPGSGNFGHAGRPGVIGGSTSRAQMGIRWRPPTTPEEQRQEELALAQKSSAAHPFFVMGLDSKLEGETMRYVAAYGQDFQTQSFPSDVAKGEQNECFKNASLLVLQRPDLTYAEGFAQTTKSAGIAFLHGWAVDQDGKVIDPTYVNDGHSYFGVKYDRTAYLKQLFKAKFYGVMGADPKTVEKAVSTGAPRLRAQMKTLGGPGSGNFGHAGRPGQVGGSGSVTNLPVYHGGVSEHSADVTYYTTNKDMAQSYVVMSNDRFGDGASLHESKLTIAKPAPESVIQQEATKFGIDNGLYTPASVFDAELHGKTEVKQLVERLKKLGYDGAVLEDIAYGKQITDKAYIKFRGLGGPGSGHHGHAGRPGEVGGSATAGFVRATKTQTKALGLPPAWTDVLVNPDPDGALVATGKDAKGRTQYRYSAKHTEKAAAEKHGRVKEFGSTLPDLRKQITKDYESKDEAVILDLIDKTSFRVGSDRDTKAKVKAYGASTLEAQHVKISGDRIDFEFIAKKGTPVHQTLSDARLAKALKPRVATGGKLFPETNDKKIRDYMGEHAPDFTPKDFRTWNATREALKIIKTMPVPKTQKDFQQARNTVGERVGKILGHTEKGGGKIALKSYISPSVFAQWEAKQ